MIIMKYIYSLKKYIIKKIISLLYIIILNGIIN